MADKVIMKIEFTINGDEVKKAGITEQDVLNSLGVGVNDTYDGIDVYRNDIGDATATGTYFIEDGSVRLLSAELEKKTRFFDEESVAEVLLAALSLYKKADGSMELGESADNLANAAEDTLNMIMEIRPDLSGRIKPYLEGKEEYVPESFDDGTVPDIDVDVNPEGTGGIINYVKDFFADPTTGKE